MVALHAAEHGRLLPRASVDADVLADVRSAPDTTSALRKTLLGLGFHFGGASPDGSATVSSEVGPR